MSSPVSAHLWKNNDVNFYAQTHNGKFLKYLIKGDGIVLVLSRKPGEAIMINEDIYIEYVRDNNGKIDIAIKAPKNFSIDRYEIFEKKKAASLVA